MGCHRRKQETSGSPREGGTVLNCGVGGRILVGELGNCKEAHSQQGDFALNKVEAKLVCSGDAGVVSGS